MTNELLGREPSFHLHHQQESSLPVSSVPIPSSVAGIRLGVPTRFRKKCGTLPVDVLKCELFHFVPVITDLTPSVLNIGLAGMPYNRFSLRPLRLTHRTTDDVIECMDVHGGLTEAEEVPQQWSMLPGVDVEDALDDIIPHGCYDVPPTEMEEPTLEHKASVAAWEEV